MAGTLTKMAIATCLFAMVFGVFVSFMVALGNTPQYNVQMEAQYAFSDYSSATQNVTSEYQLLSEGSSINQQASDTAQLQEGMSAEESKIGFWSVITTAMTEFFIAFPVLKAIGYGLSAIVIILALSGGIYLWLGRVP